VKGRLNRTQCSFCGKTREQAGRIIAGPGVFICQQCVHLCNEVLAMDQPPPRAAKTASSGWLSARILRRAPPSGWWKKLARRIRFLRFAWSD
jgi:ClpX C4-type zinc finger protein